jgi:hypothetical protein
MTYIYSRRKFTLEMRKKRVRVGKCAWREERGKENAGGET